MLILSTCVGLRERIEKHYSQTKVSVRRNTNETQIKPRVEYYINRGGTRDFLTREREYVFFPKNTVRPSLPIFVMFVPRRCQTQSMLHTPVEHGLNASSSSRQHCNITHRSTSPPYRSKRSICIDSNAGSPNVIARGQC